MSLTVCFVCGNTAYENNMQKLHSRMSHLQDDLPFFPFLEYHDPAPGAKTMGKDWSVISCQVCFAFLTQQWELFEKSRMPISKRLYWLKRPSGCEIRQPVSQVSLFCYPLIFDTQVYAMAASNNYFLVAILQY